MLQKGLIKRLPSQTTQSVKSVKEVERALLPTLNPVQPVMEQGNFTNHAAFSVCQALALTVMGREK